MLRNTIVDNSLNRIKCYLYEEENTFLYDFTQTNFGCYSGRSVVGMAVYVQQHLRSNQRQQHLGPNKISEL